MMIPSLGRTVLYRLSGHDADTINGARTVGPLNPTTRVGNRVREGDVFPFVITRVWGDTATSAVNGQLLLDGNDVQWLTSRTQGDPDEAGRWHTPPRVG